MNAATLPGPDALQSLPYTRTSLEKTRPAHETPLLLKALTGETLQRPPVWMMRQAGRYMHEYQAVRKHYSFLEICKIPEVAVEVTLQPLRAFGFDASIIFSDILIPLEAMGLDLSFSDGSGPQFANPLRHVDDLNRFQVVEPREHCAFLGQALTMMRQELNSTGIGLIGFAGAPWTLASYALEGRSWKTGRHSKQWLLQEPAALHRVLQNITDVLIPYLCMQVEAGAQVLQLFDSWAGYVPSPYFHEFVVAYQQKVIAGVKAKHPDVPIILFVKHSRGMLQHLPQTGADAFSIDELTPLAEARAILGDNAVLQGNLDSAFLFCEDAEKLRAQTERTLQAGGNKHFVFNLGHGVLPGTPRENVALVVETVKNWRGA